MDNFTWFDSPQHLAMIIKFFCDDIGEPQDEAVQLALDMWFDLDTFGTREATHSREEWQKLGLEAYLRTCRYR